MTKRGEVQDYYRDVVSKHSGNECLIWPYARSGGGYGHMKVGRKTVHVHRRICEDTHGPSPSPFHYAAHSCGKGDEACCSKEHVSWKTKAENEDDKRVHGSLIRGERHANVKLSDQDVIKIRADRRPHAVVARAFGVSDVHIGRIRRNELR